MRVQPGDNVGIGGFIITGSAPKHVLLRAIGPSLIRFGITDALADPVLELHGPGAFVTIINDNWRDTQQAAIEADGIPPTHDLESAIDATLAPGAYTAIVKGKNNTSGVALVEVYDLAQFDAGVLYGGLGGHNNGDSTNDGALVTVNQTTGAVTIVGHPIGTPPITRISGLSFDSAGNLYASTLAPAGGFPPPSGPRVSNLITLNRTGALLTSTAITVGVGGPQLAIADLATQPGTNTLFGITNPDGAAGGPGDLYSINKSTGVATLIGNTGLFFNSIAFAPDGTLYLAAANLDPATGTLIDKALKTINPSTAAVLTSVSTTHFFGALGIRSDGTIFGGTGDEHELYTINPTTGAETLIGDTGSTFVGDIAFGVPASKLANISTRAFVSTGENIVIAGFILGRNSGVDRIIVRGMGPSLTAAGVPNVLANPTLELRDADGVLISSNNDWQDNPAQAAIVTAAGLAPSNNLESAIAATLPPGLYTALLAGLNNGTGIGLVEVYDRGNGVPGPTPTPGSTPTPTPHRHPDGDSTPGASPTRGVSTPGASPTPAVSPTPVATPTPSPAALCTESFDGVTAPALPAGWAAVNVTGVGPMWVTSTATPDTAPNDAFINDETTVSDKHLDSRNIIVGSGAHTISFRNNFNTEHDPPPNEVFWDGSVLEISSPNVNAGAFTDVTDPAVGGTFVSGPYTGEIDSTAGNPLAGRMAWSGNSGGYINTVINLGTTVNGQTIKLRFRMGTDEAAGVTGQRVDTLSITGATCP